MAILEIRVDDPGGSEDMELLRVAVEPGSAVAIGDLLAEVALDKVNAEVVAPTAGRVIEVCGMAGDILATDAVLVRLETS
jgi:pyruvate dehydrogenase E2 component (dihydrolipoamide acetyltransferase)